MAVTSSQEGRSLRLALSGEVDHHRAGEIMGDIGRLLDRGLPRQVEVDLSGVTFMDSSGIAILLRTHRRVGELGGVLTVRGAPPQAAKVLQAAGLSRLITFEP